MTKQEPEDPRVRLFVALDLPDEALDRLEVWGQTALTDLALRRLPRESLHITLAFLGSRPEAELDRVREALEACRGPAVPLRLLDPVARPRRGRPGLFALPVRSSEAEKLQSRLQAVLAQEGLYKSEKRPFWPHVTVARVRRERQGSERPMLVQKYPSPLPKEVCERAFGSVRMGVYRSDLKPQGASYTPLAQVKLPDINGQQ